MRFFGDFPAKTDAKGRVFLPAAYRKVLAANGEEKLVMRRDLHQACLVLYPESLWNQMLDALRAKLNRWNREHQDIIRGFVADSEIVELDGNGRFLINKRKMNEVGINQEVRFLAVDDTIEVWDKDVFEQHLQSQKDSLGERIQEAMSDIMA
ncbi:MAG: division/cell wall cluster transcriptional repressor MraZ [Bacteroidaceae bacterium]|jgi:MraZ protein|nr:division/cell wall cluster transcriptional repressor MraZ [Bacteroidaceae bacterium]